MGEAEVRETEESRQKRNLTHTKLLMLVLLQFVIFRTRDFTKTVS